MERTARYIDRGLISEGGMGEIRRVWDTALRREVVRKLLLWDHVADATMHRRFAAEVELTARLQHPGIPTLLDAGEEDGRPWYTLREIRGRTWAEVVAAPPGDLASVHRRVAWLAQACDALAYAHSVGVIHRDLKPANLMIGEFGEVQVIDWGVAQRDGGRDHGSASSTPLPGSLTEAGAVIGTPGYMAPEQAAGRGISAASDVYAVGLLLRLGIGATPPHALGELVQACLSVDPAARPSAAALARALRDWSDGTRNAADADALVAAAAARLPAIVEARVKAEALCGAAVKLLDQAPATSPTSGEKAAAWELQDEAGRCEAAADSDAAYVEATAEAALRLVPEHDLAHRLLADHHRRQVERAERSGNVALAEVAEGRLRRHDRGDHTAFLAGHAWLDLVTDAAVMVVARRIESVGRRLVPCDPVQLGLSPLREVRMPRGSWLLELVSAGMEVVRYPVFLGRGERWSAPDHADAVIRVDPRVSANERYVPAGWFRAGGDPGAGDAVSARRLWVGAFVARVHPVTNAEWAGFLIDCVARGIDIEPLVPRVSGGGERGAAAVWEVDGGLRQVVTTAEWGGDRPVAQITWWAATQFAAWEAARTGMPWRLPHALEREKMARGVDGRRWPWGDHEDVTWSCTLRAHAGAPARAPVGAWPTDESVYGIRGLAGNVRDFCRNAWERQPDWPDNGVVDCTGGPVPGPLCEVRGGAWSAEAHFCRPAARFANAPSDRFGSGGLRLVRSLSG